MVRSQRHLREFYGVDSAGEGGGNTPRVYPPGVVAATWDARAIWDLQISDDIGPQVTTFKVPGVDALPAGATWTPATKRLNINAGVTLDGWDLSDETLGGGYITVNGANCIIRNCLLDGVVEGSVTSFPYLIQARFSIDSPNLLIEYCHIDGKKRGYPTAAGINSGSNSAGMIVQYCIIEGINADCINCSTDAEIRYNHLIIGGWGVGSHADAIQSNGGGVNVHHNLIDMTNVGQPAGTINTALMLTYATDIGPCTAFNNIIVGYAGNVAFPVNFSNSPSIDVYDNIVELNANDYWRYPTSQGRITRSDGNLNLLTGSALSEYPVSSTIPTITGEAKVGQLLTASTGNWTGAAGVYTYQWKRGAANIVGATASTYTPVSADIGSTLSVVVTKTLTGPNSGSSYATSVPTAAVVDNVVAVALDPPVSSDLIAATLPVMAFGFDRMVEGYVGNTVRLKRASDSGEQNFGFALATGIFDMAAVNAWRAGTDVDVVYFLDQMDTAKQLATVAGTTVAFIRADVVQRFGTLFNAADSSLTRSATLGGVGANMATVGALQLLNSGINVSTAGCEFHTLWSPNNRKKSTIDTTDPVAGGTTTRENILCYGLNNTNQFFHYLAGGTTYDLVRVQSGGAQIQPTNINMANHRWKAKSQWVTSYLLGNSGYSEYTSGRSCKTTAYAAGTATAIQGGSLDNGALCIGAVFTGASTALGTTNRGDFVFGGIIVTKTLTPLQRWTMQAKLSAIGQQHRIKAKADVEAYFDELILMKDATAGGLVAGRKGQTSIQFNKTLGSPTSVFGSPTVNEGLIGIKNPSVDNLDNSYQATNNFFATAISGTVMRIGFQENSTQNGALQWDLSMSAGDPRTDTRSEWSFALGYNHSTPCMVTAVAGSYDTEDRIGGRCKADGTNFGVTAYESLPGGGGNQEHGKYNFNTVHKSFIHGETFGGYTWTDATWAQTDPTRPFDLDGPVIPNVPEDIQYGWRADHFALQIATFEAPAGYNRSDSYAVNKPKFLTSKGKSWVSGGAVQPVGHLDGSYARNDYSPVKHSADNHMIQTVPWQYSFQGTRVMWAFKAGEVFTPDKIEEVQVNAYKLLLG